MSTNTEMRTFRGSSLEELVPRIREELGPDAVITRSREGVIGGIGGFFAKKCVEVEARAAAPVVPRRAAALPARVIADAYDLAEHVEETEPAPEEGDATWLAEVLLEQASPFAGELADALERGGAFDRRLEPEPEAPDPEPAVPRPEAGVAGPEASEPPVSQHAPCSGRVSRPREFGPALERAGVPIAVAEEILAEARRELAAFGPPGAAEDYVRSALGRRLCQVTDGFRSPRRVALVGPAEAGRTRVTAKLCAAYRRGGASVCALSLEQTRRALKLANAADALDLPIELATSPQALGLLAPQLEGYDLVVADTPAVSPFDADGIERLGELLEAFEPTETHLVLPLGAALDTGGLLATQLGERVWLHRVLVTGVGDLERPATPIGIALASRLTVSYLEGSSFGDAGIRPADPDTLARLVVPLGEAA